ncbi:MAG: radical SAM protein [Oscillospiraceae bacterium]|nr:radical SAM protein [Oscillospiraceae bacterium]
MQATKPFEIGPIRPPSEADSLLLRVTRNCPWNKCKFCSLYRKHPFKARTVDEVKADIDQVAQYREDILDGIPEDLYQLQPDVQERYLHIMRWMANGEESVFLQDANTVVLSFDKLREILTHLRKTLPSIKRVTTYGRADSLNKFSVEQLAELKEAGLDRIHAGYESGSDAVLELINKGCTKQMEVEAGRKVKAAGIELSIYYMPGVGGKALSDVNATETADVINKVNPDFVRIRTFVARRGTELYDEIEANQSGQCSDLEKAFELRKMIEHVEGADGYLISDHICNLFEDINGHMTKDKKQMLSVFAEFEGLPEADRHRYQLARRMGMVRSLWNIPYLTKEQSRTLDDYISKLNTPELLEEFLQKMLRRYV